METPESTAQALTSMAQELAEAQAAKDRELLALLEARVSEPIIIRKPNRAERRARRVARRAAAVRTLAIDPTARGRNRSRKKREAARARAR